MSRDYVRPCLLVVLLALQVLTGISVVNAQTTTTTNCQGYGNQLNCTSTQHPSAQEQHDRQMQQFGQAMAQLGAALAQRRAAEAQQRVAWEAAATEQAKQAAQIARANYEATTDALTRFVADTSVPSGVPVNGDLQLEWAFLNGVEARYEERGTDGARWDSHRRYALTDTPEGGRVLRMDETTQVLAKKQHIANVHTSFRYDPGTGVLLGSRERQPLYATVGPMYESVVRAGTHAFTTRMIGRGFDVSVPPGTIDINMLAVMVAAVPGQLPPSLRIWVVNERGEVVPADIVTTGETTVEEPVGPRGGTCAGAQGRKEKRDALRVRMTAGTMVDTATVLASPPHLMFTKSLKCRIIPAVFSR